jgi:hypothetical protein
MRIAKEGRVSIKPAKPNGNPCCLMDFKFNKSSTVWSQSRRVLERLLDRDLVAVACWERGMGEKVFVIHDYASPGWENEGGLDDVWSWFRSAIEETITWD